jgi:hypothetical protein
MVIAPQFDLSYGFSEGLAAVRVGKKDGYIDKTGRMVIKPKFDVASDFSGGLARVLVDGKHWYIDKSGKYIGEAPGI